jgi:XisH protein
MARDFYHNNVRLALENDGWFITHDPYPVKVDDVGYEIDFAAEAIMRLKKKRLKSLLRSRVLLDLLLSMSFIKQSVNLMIIALLLNFLTPKEFYS